MTSWGSGPCMVSVVFGAVLRQVFLVKPHSVAWEASRFMLNSLEVLWGWPLP